MRNTGVSQSWLYLFVIFIALIPSIAAGSDVSAQIDADESNMTQTVWVNNDIVQKSGDERVDYNPPVFSAVCGDDSTQRGNLTIGAEQIYTNTTINETIDHDTVQDAVRAPGTVTASLVCGNSSHNATDSVAITAAELSYSVENHGSGFVTSKLGDSGKAHSDAARPARVEIDVAPTNLTLSDLEYSFQVTPDDDNRAGIREQKSDVIEKEPGVFDIRAYINSFLADGDGFGLEFAFGDDLVLERELRPGIYSWTIDTFNDRPPYQLPYEDLNGKYAYDFEANNVGEASQLHSDDFKISVWDRGQEEYIYEDKEWMTLTDPESGRYRVSLGNMPTLDRGSYDFEFEIVNENGKPEQLLIDTVRVTKSQAFSGRVMDSTGRGIMTEMLLQDVEGRSIPIQTQSTGRYSTDLEAAVETIELTFFDRQQSTPDAKFDIYSPDLTESSKLSDTGEEIGFEYWTSPGVDIDGVNPINMMAIRFSYDINDDATAVMRFNPTGIDFDEIEVYECNEWNFQGQECFSSWSKIDGENVNVAPIDNTVNLQELDLHEVSAATAGTAKDILMNAYVVGVPSALELQGQPPIQLNKERVGAGGELDIAGTVVDSVGSTVQDANVTLELIDEDAETVATYETDTDSTGFFRITDPAPDTAGEYRMRVDIEKTPYQSYEYTSRNFLEVYWDMDISIRGGDDATIQMGEPSDITFEIANTGQVEVQNLNMDISGVPTDFYELGDIPSTIASGSTETVTLTTTFPDDYCPAPCNDPPVFDIGVSGEANGQTLEAQTSLFTQLDRQDTSSTEPTGNTDDGDQFISFSQLQPSQVGAVIQSQSDVNIALGMIFIFLVLLAVAIKRKNKGDETASRRRGDRPVVQKPKVSASESPETDEESPVQEESEDEKTMEVSDHEDEKFVCEETGETFDTKEALEMYKKMNDIA